MKKNVILGHVDFFWNSLDITNMNIFHNLMAKNPKKNHSNKPLSKSLNLNVLIIFWGSIFYLILCFKNFGNLFSMFWKKKFKLKKNLKIYLNHYFEIHIK